MYIGLQVKSPLFFLAFNEIKFSQQMFENTQISNFIKIRPVGKRIVPGE